MSISRASCSGYDNASPWGASVVLHDYVSLDQRRDREPQVSVKNYVAGGNVRLHKRGIHVVLGKHLVLPVLGWGELMRDVAFFVTYVPTSTYLIGSSYLEGKIVGAADEHVLASE